MSASQVDRRSLSSLGEKLERVTLARALLVTLLLTSAVVLNVNDVDSLSDPTYNGIWYLIITTYIATVGYAIFIRFAAELDTLAYVQAAGDALLACGLVLLTGGADSIFVFLYFLCIVSSANLLGREGALFSASCCSIAFGVNVFIQTGHIPGLAHLGTAAGADAIVPTYNVAITIIEFYAVGVLAGHLAERLGQVGSELERRSMDVRQLRALNENIVDSVAGGLITVSRRGRVMSFNRGAESICALPETGILGARFSEVLPELADEVSRFGATPNKHDRQSEIWLRRGPDDSRLLSVSVAGLFDANRRETGHIIHFTDRTAVHELQEYAHRQERLAVVGELSAAIAHELRNPLASISGAIQMLADTGERDGAQNRLMAIVLREIDRLNDLVKEFLEYARPKALEMTQVDLASVVDDTVRLFEQRSSDSKIETAVNLGSGMSVWADEGALRQVLWNLLVNAAQAMEDGGVVTVSGVQLFGGRDPRPFIELKIEDTGPGFDEETRSHLFDPFYTTKDEGTGLGLATVYRLVEAHGGMIFADSSERGTSFRMMLPCEPSESVTGAVAGHRPNEFELNLTTSGPSGPETEE